MADSNGKKGKGAGEGEAPKSLENFITGEYVRQKAAGNMDPSEEIDDDRTNKFFERAIKESQRMNREVEKSKAKSDQLHQELGAARMAAWQAEHAAEVLTPEQIKAMQQASKPEPEGHGSVSTSPRTSTEDRSREDHESPQDSGS